MKEVLGELQMVSKLAPARSVWN